VNERFYQILVAVLVVVVMYSLLSSPKNKGNYNVNVKSSVSAADGLDLTAVGGLIKKSRDGEHLEKLINDKDAGVNNLDLDEDGSVDYIKVTEYGNDSSKGFSLTVEPSKGEEQELATIQIEKTGADQANVEIHGNKNIYGHNHYHQSHFPIGSFLLMSYLWRPHPFYMSPWGFGYYPGYYRPYPIVSAGAYHSRTRTVSRSANMKPASNSRIKSSPGSPNARKSASNIKAPLRNPTTAQKSFQKRNPSKSVRSGGFGRRSRTSSSSRPSVRSSSSRRSGGFSRGK
jgi:hypothetical protein